MERSKQEMPFTTNSSIRVPHSDRYVPKHSVHDTTRYITIEGDDDAKASDSGKVDYMDISDVSAPEATAAATDGYNGNDDQTPDIAEATPESTAEGVTGATDATTEAVPIDANTETQSATTDDAEEQDADEHAAQRIAELSDRLTKALNAVHDAEAKRDQAFKDLSNYKRRMDDEKERARREAVADVGKAVMPAIDDLERVIEHYAAQKDDDTLAAVASGCDGIRRKLLGSLSALGIEQIDPTGKEFDPDTSMAIAHEQHDGYEPNTVYATYQKGYKIGDKVIRTATVGVAK
jgi:molecular chaperone GrpE